MAILSHAVGGHGTKVDKGPRMSVFTSRNRIPLSLFQGHDNASWTSHGELLHEHVNRLLAAGASLTQG